MKSRILFAAALGVLLAVLLAGGVLAQGDGPLAPWPLPTAIPMSDAQCLDCHASAGLLARFPDGSQLNLTVQAGDLTGSLHAEKGIACAQCHANIQGFPHNLSYDSARAFVVDANRACSACHEGAYAAYRNGHHYTKQASGENRAAVCSDCHGGHQTRAFDGNKAAIAQACQQCHSEIYAVYAQSVHGKALLEEDNQDVPTCVDCHDYHETAGPALEGYHIKSPQICAQCHADQELMAQYDVNTDVFETYVADFHGTTVTIFEKIAPDQAINKPVCVDCHGVHNILPPDDENSTVMKANLSVTCQRCHPDALPDFPAAWLSHHEPNWQTAPLVTAVNWFYNIVIPVTLGGMAFFVVTQSIRNWRKGKKHQEIAQ